MSIVSGSDEGRLHRERPYSHDLYLDNSEWPNSNTVSQLSPVSSGDLADLPARLIAHRLSPEERRLVKESGPKRQLVLTSVRSNTTLDQQEDTPTTPSADLSCAESLTADTEYVHPGAADPFGPSATRYAQLSSVAPLNKGNS